MTIKAAQKAGYYAGYQHGLSGNSYNPAPDLIGSLTQDTYLKIYLESYDKGFSPGKQAKDLVLDPRARNLMNARDINGPERERE